MIKLIEPIISNKLEYPEPTVVSVPFTPFDKPNFRFILDKQNSVLQFDYDFLLPPDRIQLFAEHNAIINADFYSYLIDKYMMSFMDEYTLSNINCELTAYEDWKLFNRKLTLNQLYLHCAGVEFCFALK